MSIENDINQWIAEKGYMPGHKTRSLFEEALAELTRLRAIEVAARKAGQVTADGVFAQIGMKVWHPKHGEPSNRYSKSYGDGFNIGFEEGKEYFYYTASQCYSTREAAEAARKPERAGVEE